MYVIGLAGGVGSGKTEVARCLKEQYGAELLLTDELGHLVMEKGQDGYDRVIERFGEEILDGEEQIDRERLAQVIFEEEQAREDLEQIIHPAVHRYIRKFLGEHRDQEELVVLESALFFESGCDAYCQEVWYVYVPKKIRIARLMQGRGYTREKCEAVIASQMGQRELLSHCQKVLLNDRGMSEIPVQIRSLIGPCRTKAADGPARD